MQSRIKFNPLTREVEIEGSEKFVKAHLDKIQAILSGTKEKAKRGRKPKKAAVTMKPRKVKALKVKKVKRVAKKAAGRPKKVVAVPKRKKKVRVPRAKKVKEEPKKKPVVKVKRVLRKRAVRKTVKAAEVQQLGSDVVTTQSIE